MLWAYGPFLGPTKFGGLGKPLPANSFHFSPNLPGRPLVKGEREHIRADRSHMNQINVREIAEEHRLGEIFWHDGLPTIEAIPFVPERVALRPEYPRPQFVRQEWQNLNGIWGFAFDDDDCGLRERWFEPAAVCQPWPQRINVPFVYQSELSGIGSREAHNILWYHRHFHLPLNWHGRRIIFHCGAADYRAWVWVNGQLATFHEGGHTPFQADITDLLESENHLVIRVEDVLTDLTQPRGKQYWQEQSEGIFYTPSSGIWQTVWLEPVHPLHLSQVQFTPDIHAGAITITCRASQPAAAHLTAEITFAGSWVASAIIELSEGGGSATVPLSDLHLWSPEEPNLYDVKLRLLAEGQLCDEVQSYFGVREMAVVAGRVHLNGAPYTMKLVLDQGYFPGGLLTPASDEAMRHDVELTKAMGFNGVRKHQKVEDPRYLYWADRLGLLVWGEMANAYQYSETAVMRLMAEWAQVIARDYNHPCIVAWVPLNESWGVPQLWHDPRQIHLLYALYHQTKALDPTRLVISNDGWEHALSDLCTIHDYGSDTAVLTSRYSEMTELLAFQPSERPIYAPGCAYQGQPILISECGGIAYQVSEEKGWGYTCANSAVDFGESYGRLINTLLSVPLVQGYCYTQLTDVEQEINGLLTFDREPKLPLETVRAINEGRHLEPA